jgi:hypothetical protein
MLRINTTTDITKGVAKEYKPGITAMIRPCTRNDYRRVVASQPEGETLRNQQVIAYHALLSWSGIIDQDGNALPCTREMIDLVCAVEPDFEDWVIVESTAMLQALRLAEGAELKNSAASAEALPPAPAEA